MDIRNIDFYKSSQLFSFNSINETKNTFIKDNKKLPNSIKTLLKIQQRIIRIFMNSLGKYPPVKYPPKGNYPLVKYPPKLYQNHIAINEFRAKCKYENGKMIINKAMNLFSQNIENYQQWAMGTSTIGPKYMSINIQWGKAPGRGPTY